MIRASLLIFTCLLVCGCVSTGNSHLSSDDTMEKIQVGQTTKQQVMDLLGKPDNQVTTEMGGETKEWWFYSYASAVINPVDYLLLYGFWFNGIGTFDTEYDLTVAFDQGVVSSLSRLKTEFDMGRPFMSSQVSSDSSKTMGRSIHFDDRMEARN